MTKGRFFRLGILSILSTGFLTTSTAPTPDAGRESRWHLVPSPTNNHLTHVVMDSRDRGHAAGGYLLSYQNGTWSIDEDRRVTSLVGDARGSRWSTATTFTYESHLFQLDGTRWEQVSHPLANQVNAIAVSPEGVLWLGGDRELASRGTSGWQFHPIPDARRAVIQLSGASSKNVWMLSSDLRLHFFDGRQWRRYLTDRQVRSIHFDDPAHGFALAGAELLEFRDSTWRYHSQHPKLSLAVKVIALPSGTLWAIGARGFIARHRGGEWEIVDAPTHEDLNDIDMLTETEGWIVGQNGTILRYTRDDVPPHAARRVGFQQRPITQQAKEINDEYGVAIDDLDNDGSMDVYTICIFESNRAFMNRSALPRNDDRVGDELLFYEEAVVRNITGVTGDSAARNLADLYLGVGLADIDNDGDQDLFLCNLTGSNRLFLNNGSGVFRNVSEQRNRAAGGRERSNAAIFGDVDNDGDLDLFVLNEETTNRLFLNDGNGYFTEITEEAGLSTMSGGMSAAFGDIDGDGMLDLAVANWSSVNRLYRNVTSGGRVRFIDITDQAGMAGEPHTKSNAVVFADVDNDGDLDLFITNRKSSNRLYLNDGHGMFTDATVSMVGLDSMLSYGASFADFDHDGYLDLYVANVGENVLYRNDRGQRFVVATAAFGAWLGGYSTGTATGDIDNDGDMDLYVANYMDGSSMLYVNSVNDRSFLTVDVEGTISNRDGIGVKVWLYRSGYANVRTYLLGYREVSGGEGYASRSSRRVHFGVDPSQRHDVVIEFPASGMRQVLRNIPAGEHRKVVEELGLTAVNTRLVKALRRNVIDPEVQRELAKGALVLLLLAVSIAVGRKRHGWNGRFQLALHGGVAMLYGIQIALFRYEPFHIATLFPIVSVVSMLLIVHLVYERVVMVRLARQERQRTRDRIARDLHDDIASTLGSTLIYTEALKHSQTISSPQDKELLDKVCRLLIDASDAMTDIVWTVAPQHDTLGDLLVRLRMYITEMCKANGLASESVIGNVEKKLEISDDVRRNIYLIFKEALTNVIKHAEATTVNFSASMEDGVAILALRDDGKGFPESVGVSDSRHGYGVGNMRRRAEEVGAELTIVSTDGSGTSVLLRRKMT